MTIKEVTRKLRKNQTNSEKIFWELVRNRKLVGRKFFRQHALKFFFEGKERFFIADFYCSELKLVIELDGSIHDNQQEYDKFRDYIINSMKITVLRFSNDDIENNIAEVLNKLIPILSTSKREMV